MCDIAYVKSGDELLCKPDYSWFSEWDRARSDTNSDFKCLIPLIFLTRTFATFTILCFYNLETSVET